MDRQLGALLEIGDRRLAIRNLDRVVFPRAGITKAALLDYYVRVAGVMLPHLRERLLHMHRYPEGVDGPRFWQKDCPKHRPEWVQTAPVWSPAKRTDIDFCVVNDAASLLWAVNLGSIELHTSLHTRAELHRPTTIAFDLDPGEGVDVLGCAEVALLVRDVLADIGLESWIKTSGSKGLQLYVPLNTDVTYATTKPMARAIAEAMEGQRPERIVSRMAKKLRSGKVLIDWSQNTEHKSMVCVYAVRAKARPTVSTPLTWAEVEAALDAGDPAMLSFEMDAVLDRIDEHGDLFAGVLETTQTVRQASSS